MTMVGMRKSVMKKGFFVPVLAVSVAVMLLGCGVETASTAATAAQLKAQEAEQAQRQLEAAKKKIDAAQQVMQQRIEDADRDASADHSASPPTATP
jgi:type II secretory pathway component PulL